MCMHMFLQAHCHYMVLKMFRDKVDQIEDPGVHSVMSTLAHLYAIHGMGNFTGDFLQVRLLSLLGLLLGAY